MMLSSFSSFHLGFLFLHIFLIDNAQVVMLRLDNIRLIDL